MSLCASSSPIVASRWACARNNSGLSGFNAKRASNQRRLSNTSPDKIAVYSRILRVISSPGTDAWDWSSKSLALPSLPLSSATKAIFLASGAVRYSISSIVSSRETASLAGPGANSGLVSWSASRAMPATRVSNACNASPCP